MAIKQISYDLTENNIKQYTCDSTDKVSAYPVSCDKGSTMAVLNVAGNGIKKLIFDGNTWRYTWNEITANNLIETEVVSLNDDTYVIDCDYKSAKNVRIIATEATSISVNKIPTECHLTIGLDCTTSANITLPTNFTFGEYPVVNGFTPVLGNIYMLDFYTFNGGLNWFGNVLFAKNYVPVNAVLKTGTPVNGQEASVSIPATEITGMAENDTFVFGEFVATKVLADPADLEFIDIAGLALLFNATVTTFTATVNETSGALDIVCKEKGDEGNDINAKVINIFLTSGGSAVLESSINITTATITGLEVGCQVKFLDTIFTKVAENPVANEFTNVSELTTLLDSLDGWVATVDETHITLTAGVVGEENNNLPLNIIYNHLTADGTDGGVGFVGQTIFDSNYLYICTEYTPESGALWKKVQLTEV